MNDMWVDLVPVLGAMMISPARTMAVILLLHTPKRAVTALGFVVGMVGAMLIQGVVFGALLRFVGLSDRAAGESLDTFIGALFLVGGVLLLVGALRMARPPEGGGGALESAFAKLEAATPRLAATIGFGWIFASPKQWVFVLTAVSIVYSAYLRPIAAVANYLVFTLLVQLVYLVIVVVVAVVPGLIDGFLDTVFTWIRERLRTIAVALFVVLGLAFVVKAVTILNV